MPKEADDLLKSVISKIDGVPLEKIELKDGRKVIKKKEKIKEVKNSSIKGECLSNDQGMVIVDNQSDREGWASTQVKKHTRTLKIKDDIWVWTSYDFYLYARELYSKKYNNPWNIRTCGGSFNEICKIMDSLQERMGFVSNLAVKDYFDYFFKYYIDSFKRIKGDFYFKQMRNEEPLKSFVSSYNYKNSLNAYFNNSVDTRKVIENKEILSSFNIGLSSLLIRYGIIITVNWLIENKGMSKVDALSDVYRECRNLNKLKQLPLVKRATEVYSPYPDFLLFKDAKNLLCEFNKDDILTIEFSNESETYKIFKCLRKKDNGA